MSKELKDYGIQEIEVKNQYHKSKKKLFKIGIKEVSEFEYEILKYLFEHKNSFVLREDVIVIRKQFYRNPSKMRNVAPEISRIISILNKTFQELEIPFEILSANGKVGLFVNQ